MKFKGFFKEVVERSQEDGAHLEKGRRKNDSEIILLTLRNKYSLCVCVCVWVSLLNTLS